MCQIHNLPPIVSVKKKKEILGNLGSPSVRPTSSQKISKKFAIIRISLTLKIKRTIQISMEISDKLL